MKTKVFVSGGGVYEANKKLGAGFLEAVYQEIIRVIRVNSSVPVQGTFNSSSPWLF
jgi:hypothetical protein